MRDFVIDYNNIRVAINLHAWGPMFITPFNFDNDQNDLLSDNHLKAQAFYDNIFYNDVSPLGYTYGNGAITIGYTANGEASDWMLGVRGIYAISPEIGTWDPNTDWFFIDSSILLKDVLDTNFGWIEAIMTRFFPRIELEHTYSVVKDEGLDSS